jgi:hypothetical protein
LLEHLATTPTTVEAETATLSMTERQIARNDDLAALLLHANLQGQTVLWEE